MKHLRDKNKIPDIAQLELDWTLNAGILVALIAIYYSLVLNVLTGNVTLINFEAFILTAVLAVIGCVILETYFKKKIKP